MRLIYQFIAILCLVEAASSIAISLPRGLSLKGGGGGGGRGGGGGGRSSSSGGTRSSGSSSSSSGTYVPTGPAGRGGSGNTGRPAIVSSTAANRAANYFSPGGGQRVILPSTSVFKGREMGGGARADVAGTRGYGSGYPYYQGDIRRTGVIGQPFPFGFWPVYWGGHGHSHEYGGNATVEAERPGGEQVIILLAPTVNDTTWSSTPIGQGNESLWMIGDRESVTALLSLLVDPSSSYTYGCGVKTGTPIPFNGTSTQSPVRFENVVQWYRSSSFALAYQRYNNSYALSPLNETTRLDWSESTPLPSTFESSSFLQCVNKTITAALPILDAEQETHALSPGEIAGIVIGSIAAALLLIVLLVPPVRRPVFKKLKALKSRNIKYTPVAGTTNPPKKPVVETAADREPASPPPPSFPLPVHYDPYNPEKASIPPPSMPSPSPSPRLNSNLAIPRNERDSVYSTQTLVEDAEKGYGHHRKSSSFNLK